MPPAVGRDRLVRLFAMVAHDRSCQGIQASGIQIDAHENHGIIADPGGMDPQDLIAAGFTYSNGQVGNPDTWSLQITEPDGGGLLGRIIVVPSTPGARARYALNGGAYFVGHVPGDEHWKWKPDEAWPAAFDLVDISFPEGLSAFDPSLGHQRFKAVTFPGPPSVPATPGASWYEISTGPLGNEQLVGLMKHDHAEGQEWFAVPGALIDGLIPPYGGIWRFRRTSTGAYGSMRRVIAPRRP